MSFRVTIITLFLAVAGVVFAVLTAGDAQDVLGGPDDGGGPVLASDALDPAGVNAIVLRRQDADVPYRFEATPAGWRQVEPFAYPMDRYSMEQLPRLADELLWTERYDVDDLPEGVTLSGLGLEPPRGRLELLAGGDPVVFDFGRQGIAGRAYLRVEGQPFVYVVNQELHERALEMDPKEWRDRSIFPLADQPLDRIVIEAAGSTTELVRDGRSWRIASPVRSRASAEAVTMLLDALARASAAGFLLDQPDDLARFGLAEPAGRLRIEGARLVEQDGDVAREPFAAELRIGSRMGAASQDRFGIVPDRPTVIRVPEAAIEALFRPANALVGATGTGAQPADVKLIRIATDAHDFTLERELEEWSIVDRSETSVNPQAVDKLLDTLANLQASQVLLREYPRELEVAVVTLLGYDRLPIDTVRIVRDPSTGNWAFENGDDVLRIMPADLELPLSPEAFASERAPR